MRELFDQIPVALRAIAEMEEWLGRVESHRTWPECYEAPRRCAWVVDLKQRYAAIYDLPMRERLALRRELVAAIPEITRVAWYLMATAWRLDAKREQEPSFMRDILLADDGLRIMPAEWYDGKPTSGACGPVVGAPGTPTFYVDEAWTYLGRDGSGGRPDAERAGALSPAAADDIGR